MHGELSAIKHTGAADADLQHGVSVVEHIELLRQTWAAQYAGHFAHSTRRLREETVQKISETPSFDDIYATFGERILNLAYRMTGNEETARDLTQDIFIKVYQNLATFEGRSQIYTWIYRIAVNHITNQQKKERRHRWLSLMDEKVSDLVRRGNVSSQTSRTSAMPGIERDLEAADRARIVWVCVQSLPEKYRVPLMLHNYEGMSYQDVADTMGLTLSAVEARIHRAKKKLIKKLEPWLDRI
ncbi:MAG: sigma-70 family RNA polymerase sigma factor [Candidatus Latescibacterota bacterium]|nr:MAG: sigma-70 family RNA polymerase sigma factor [Candidatus Latescibacterota bacterium]